MSRDEAIELFGKLISSVVRVENGKSLVNEKAISSCNRINNITEHPNETVSFVAVIDHHLVSLAIKQKKIIGLARVESNYDASARWMDPAFVHEYKRYLALNTYKVVGEPSITKDDMRNHGININSFMKACADRTNYDPKPKKKVSKKHEQDLKRLEEYTKAGTVQKKGSAERVSNKPSGFTAI